MINLLRIGDIAVYYGNNRRLLGHVCQIVGIHDQALPLLRWKVMSLRSPQINGIAASNQLASALDEVRA